MPRTETLGDLLVRLRALGIEANPVEVQGAGVTKVAITISAAEFVAHQLEAAKQWEQG